MVENILNANHIGYRIKIDLKSKGTAMYIKPILNKNSKMHKKTAIHIQIVSKPNISLHNGYHMIHRI